MYKFVLALALGLLAACVGSQDETPPDCQADGYRGLIGQNVAGITLPADLNHRIIGPNTAVTMDFLADRINFIIDEANTIARIQCG